MIDIFVKPLQVAAKPGLCSPGARHGGQISFLGTAWGYFPAGVWGMWFLQLNHTEVGTGDLQPLPHTVLLLSTWLLCLVISLSLVIVQSEGAEQSRVTDEPSLSPGLSGMAQGSLCLGHAKCLGVGSSPTVCSGFWGVLGQWEACGDPGQCCPCLGERLDGFQGSSLFKDVSRGCWALPGATPEL